LKRPGSVDHRKTAGADCGPVRAIAAWRTPPSLASGWGFRGRRLSRAWGNPCRRRELGRGRRQLPWILLYSADL